MPEEPIDRGPDRRASRRSILGASAGTIAAATSLSGCLSSIPGLDGGTGDASVGLPPGGSSSFRHSIPADGVDEVESFGPAFVFLPQRDGSEHLGVPLGFARTWLKPTVDYLGVGIERYDRAVLTGDSVALDGPVDPDAVGETLLGSGYEATASYRGHDVYVRSDHPRACAVRAGRAVWAHGSHHLERVRAHVDAEAGHAARLHEAVPAYGRLADRVGVRPFLTTNSTGVSRVVDDAAAVANGFDIDENGVYRLTVAVLEPDAEPPRSAIEDRFVDVFTGEEATATEVTIRDGIVTAAARAPLDVVRKNLETERAFPPQTTWGIDVEADRYVLRHEAGETVDASRLELVDETADSHSIGSDPDRTVAPGAEFTFDRSTIGAEFRLVWSAHDESALLFEYEAT